ncbi:hypothetical protein BDV98DRAFT_560909 [Pterulicium gracile]|uniref:Uncharacterized protein n=1 Tax=Pterulicium gracile TaxID=1884261 RepID=A0A5C3R062_9AGAR|nr:hypothetical protein BDV98DRAFT_560909 [Pterula gracilis]
MSSYRAPFIPSTPPRTPSPELVHNPLAPPTRRARPPSSIYLPQPNMHSPSDRPIPSPRKSILVKRSCRSLKPGSPNLHSAVLPASPTSLRAISRKSSSRSLSLAQTYRSPPPSPTIVSPPPPVPPIPSFMLDSACSTSKPEVLRPYASDDAISPISLVPKSSFVHLHPGGTTVHCCTVSLGIP